MHQTCIVLLAFHILLGKLSFSFTEYNSGLVLRAFCSLNSHNYDQEDTSEVRGTLTTWDWISACCC